MLSLNDRSVVGGRPKYFSCDLPNEASKQFDLEMRGMSFDVLEKC